MAFQSAIRPFSQFDRALQALQAPSRKAFCYKPKDDLLRFLQGL
jgi:hypothetical protein